MTNIFENAYFGKAYKTRDGRKSLYLGSFYRLNGEKVVLAVEDSVDNLLYVYPDGWYDPINDIGDRKENDLDIVSEWQEPIDEKKLKNLSYDEAQLYSVVKNKDWQEGFEAGYRYRKAMEDKQ